MDEVQASKTPAHLWIVGILSLLWNCIGVIDYSMTRMRNTDYLSAMMPGTDPSVFLAYVDGLPLWMSIGWAIGVWGAFLGSILLLMRSRWAVLSFGLSLVGAVLSLIYQLTRGPAPGMATEGVAAMVPYLIVLIAAGLYYYAWRQRGNGVLR